MASLDAIGHNHPALKYTCRSTVGAMRGQFLIPLMPVALHAALKKNPKAMQAFDKLPPSGKKKAVLLIDSAKAEEPK